MNAEEFVAALGPLAPLYQDREVLEILVDGPEAVYVERRGRLEATGVRFESPAALSATVAALFGTPSASIMEWQRPDGTRLLAVLPPTAMDGPAFVIRKPTPHTLTWEHLLKFGALTPEVRALVEEALRQGVNLLIAGGPGSGKTTFANIVAGSIPPEQRLIVVEALPELQVTHPRCLRLVASEAALKLEDLLLTAAKMRPDWLIMGELSTPAALTAVQILGRGHRGLTTTHANSPEDALTRLEALCLMANLGLGLAEIRTLIAAAFRLITYQEQLADGCRRVTQVVELAGLENGRYVLRPLIRYDAATDQWVATGVKPTWA